MTNIQDQELKNENPDPNKVGSGVRKWRII
jgi:hypothetical protein